MARPPVQIEIPPDGNKPLFPQRPQGKPTRPQPGVGKGRWKGFFLLFFILVILLVPIGAVLLDEMQSSRLQSRYLSRLTQKFSFLVEPGPSPSIRFPAAGPYDERAGYVGLPGFIDRLTQNGYEVAVQARMSPALLSSVEHGFHATYREKAQTGLQIAGRQGRSMFSSSFPARVFGGFEEIPEIAVQALLFIENRELLDQRQPFKNPAVEWDRLGKAVLDMLLSLVDPDRRVPGGSTLATQTEKYRHSPGGLTSSVRDKFVQMVSASLRAYQDGPDTRKARRRIVLDFMNSIPLGASPGHGEVTGLGDGLYAWYGAEFGPVATLLAHRPKDGADPSLAGWALAMKQATSLFVAQRRPSFYLLENPTALEEKTNSYLRLMTAAGLLARHERDAALAQRLAVRRRAPEPTEQVSFVERKAANTVRTNLLSLLGISQFYQLNHLDLTVQSTLDQDVQQQVSATLLELGTPEGAETAGLRVKRLLEQADPAGVIYSLTLYEHKNGANRLRIQTDNYDQPLNINEGIKLELGSSAKLRTLVSYLEIITELHQRLSPLGKAELRAARVESADKLSRWVVDFLTVSPDRSLDAILAAAMERRYSASPHEGFFTGGGVHTFVNFDKKDDSGVFSVEKALHDSINLVFIRMMRDIVNYHLYRIPGVAELLADSDDPRRHDYLSRFADQEGSLFQRRFYRKYAGKSQEEAIDILLHSVRPIPERLAAVYRYVYPQHGEEEFGAFMRDHFRNPVLSKSTLAKLYKNYGPDAWSLIDRGYIARIHPLELWTVNFLARQPTASLEEIMRAGAGERQTVYTWLFKTTRKNRQDTRIRSMLEVEAFDTLHESWKRLGYPFESLVPSFATAIGSSADRPAALAELMGIIVNDGRWYPSVRAEELHFGASTPYETLLRHRPAPGEQRMAPEVARTLRRALAGVVTDGTAKRLAGAFTLPDGASIPVGGKTGTGDNRHETYGPGGRVIQSRVINRTAVFVFYIGDRFFGTISAYVPGKEAGNYGFTSGLPVQVLKTLAPTLLPLLAPSREPLAPQAEMLVL